LILVMVYGCADRSFKWDLQLSKCKTPVGYFPDET